MTNQELQGMTLDKLEAKKTEMEGQESFDVDAYSQIVAQISALEAEAEKAEVQQKRTQAQEEKIATISLPHDFNQAFDDPRANEIITELVKQYQREAYAEHNAEMAKLQSEHNEKLRASVERETQLSHQLDKLQQAHSQLQTSHNQLQIDHNALQHEHAETKAQLDEMTVNRDNAANQLRDAQAEIERLNSQVDDLRKEAAVGARNAQKVTDIGTSDKLTALVNESLADKAHRKMMSFYDRNPDLKPADIPEVQPPATQETPFRPEGNDSSAQPEGDQLPAAETTSGIGEQFQTQDQVEGQSELPASNTGEMVRQASGDLEERVSALEARVKVLEQGVKAVA